MGISVCSIWLWGTTSSLNKIQDESQVAKEENAQAKEKTQEDACKVQVDPHPTIFNFVKIYYKITRKFQHLGEPEDTIVERLKLLSTSAEVEGTFIVCKLSINCY